MSRPLQQGRETGLKSKYGNGNGGLIANEQSEGPGYGKLIREDIQCRGILAKPT